MSVANSAGCILIVGDSVLLAERAPTCYITGRSLAFPYYWSVFVGAIEANEDPIACAQRELLEETHVKVDINQLSYVDTINNDKGKLILYGASLDKLPKVKINEEHLQYGWFKIDHLDSFSGKIDQTIIDCINLYKKNQKN